MKDIFDPTSPPLERWLVTPALTLTLLIGGCGAGSVEEPDEAALDNAGRVSSVALGGTSTAASTAVPPGAPPEGLGEAVVDTPTEASERAAGWTFDEEATEAPLEGAVSVEVLAEVPTEAPTEALIETSSETPVETPVETLTATPVDRPETSTPRTDGPIASIDEEREAAAKAPGPFEPIETETVVEADPAEHAEADSLPAPEREAEAAPAAALPLSAPRPASAEITAEPPAGEAAPVDTAAVAVAVDEGGDGGDSPRRFDSATTAGFTGELLDDGTVRVAWTAEPNARGYNVYRQAKYVTTVHAPEFIDKDIFDRDYYYEVHAFDGASPARFSTIATGLTVRVRGLGRPDPDAKPSNEGMLDSYDLVFADEFDTGELDASKWETEFLWGPDRTINSEEQYYVNILDDPDFGFDPFTFENGALVINSIPTPAALRDKANGQPYLSGLITSYESFKFTYGYVEARARVPFGRGYWPAFWLLNAYYDNEKPEIDIMEFIGHDQDVVYHTYHYHDANDELRSTESEPTPGVDYTAGFHTYAVDWRPGLIVYYVDGVEVHRVSDPRVSREDMYVIANTALGGWWAGSPDESTPFPGRYELDYIRVYRQRQPYAEPPLSDGASGVEPASTVPGASPAHRPPFDLWPQGYPGRGR